MSKVLLVEDDNNLREIFEMRLQADGYKTVVAGDGEEGLVVAMREKPDLIVADVMMPKLSGFEMLETLRAAPEMSNTKVIMMTALGQAEDQARGEKLGVIKYLVKSQVTLEDFARVVQEVLQAGPSGPKQPGPPGESVSDNSPSINNNQESEKSMPPADNAAPTNPDPAADDSAAAANPISSGMPPVDDPAVPASDPIAPVSDGQQSSAEEQSSVNSQIDSFVSSTPADSTSAVDSGASSSGSSTPTEHADIAVADAPADAPSTDDAAPAGDAPAGDDAAAPPSGL